MNGGNGYNGTMSDNAMWAILIVCLTIVICSIAAAIAGTIYATNKLAMENGYVHAQRVGAVGLMWVKPDNTNTN